MKNENALVNEKPSRRELLITLVHRVNRLELRLQEILDEMRQGFRDLRGESGVVKSDVSGS
ncbi:hypothetical protein EPN90_02070 [Patescibacteria group bacterium]|nr:MAG: hypothetical protein EPN90_02070 [Patescibacteria group bacterium]